MSYFETLDSAEQSERQSSDLAGVVHAILLRKSGDHHVRVSDRLHLIHQLRIR